MANQTDPVRWEMHMRTLLTAAVLGLWALPVATAQLSPDDAGKHLGETATVCGVVGPPSSTPIRDHGRRSSIAPVIG